MYRGSWVRILSIMATQKVVNSKGVYAVASGVKFLGSIFPDYNLGIRRSNFTYKDFDLRFLIDIHKRGKF